MLLGVTPEARSSGGSVWPSWGGEGGGGRVVLEQMLKLEAPGHQAGRGSLTINTGTRRLRSWVRPLGSHHTSAWQVWQNDHQELLNAAAQRGCGNVLSPWIGVN